MSVAPSDIKGILDLPHLRPVMVLLNEGDMETRIVGGAVRNYLMGYPVADFDLATTARPEIIAQRASAAGWKMVPTGIDHGTVTIVTEHTVVEVTTLREDLATDGRRATVQFGQDFKADAIRRDFTINALSVDLAGQLYDYCGGIADIAARRIRFIGDAHQRIREDYLRILRFFRFQSWYGAGVPDRVSLDAAISEMRGLDLISAERIRTELMKLLQGSQALKVVEIMADAGILLRILSSVANIGQLARLPSDAPAIEKLAALAVMVREDASRLRTRLRLSNMEHESLDSYAVIVEKIKALQSKIDQSDIRRFVAQYDPILVLRAYQTTETSQPLEKEVLNLLKRFSDGTEPIPVFPLRGADLVNLGYAKGPQIGQLIERARKLWIEDGCPTGEEVPARLLNALSSAVRAPCK